MHLTIADRIAAAAGAAYFAYRIYTAWRDGIYYGDGDLDVESDRNPLAFSLTVLVSLLLVGLCTFLVFA
jgi:hypothetical protein